MKHIIIFALIALTSCAHEMAQVSEPTWTPSALNKQKVALDGQVVTLRGYLIHEPEAYAVWDSQKAMEAGDASNCISLLYPANLRSEIVRANRSSVALVGVFHRNVTAANQVHLGLCNYTGVAVTQIREAP